MRNKGKSIDGVRRRIPECRKETKAHLERSTKDNDTVSTGVSLDPAQAIWDVRVRYVDQTAQ